MLCKIASLIVATLATASHAQTYVWVGAGPNNRWSHPANWSTGTVPTSSSTSTLDFTQIDPFGYLYPDLNNDLGEDFSVGVLRYGDFNLTGGRIQVHSAVRSVSPFHRHYVQPRLRLAGNVTFYSSIAPGTPGGSPAQVAGLWEVSGTGHATFRGGWKVSRLDVTGLTIENDSSLAAYAPAPLQLSNLVVRGIYDVEGRVTLPAGSVLDLTAGTVDLGRNDNTLGAPVKGSASFGSNVRLGTWALQGWSLDRIDVDGTLDLSVSRIVEGSSYYRPSLSDSSPASFVTLASYGNRVGTLDVDHVTFNVFRPSGAFSAREFPIIYTSAENSGPGEIRVLIPEPSSLLVLAGGALLVRRRRRQLVA